MTRFKPWYEENWKCFCLSMSKEQIARGEWKIQNSRARIDNGILPAESQRDAVTLTHFNSTWFYEEMMRGLLAKLGPSRSACINSKKGCHKPMSYRIGPPRPKESYTFHKVSNWVSLRETNVRGGLCSRVTTKSPPNILGSTWWMCLDPSPAEIKRG